MDFAREIDTTTLVSKILTDRRNILEQSPEDLPEYISVASSRAEQFKKPAAVLDNIILPKVNSINSLKNDIIVLGGSTSLGAACYSSNTANLAPIYGDLIVGVATAMGSSLGISGIGTLAVVAYGTVNYDRLRIWNYPNLEAQNTTSDNPFAGEAWVTVTISNVGTGKSSNYAINDNGVAGIVFAFTSSGGCSGNASIVTNISTKLSEITTIRSGISTDIDKATVVKNYRMGYKLEEWSYNKVITSQQAEKISLDGVLGIITDPTYGGPY